MIEVKTIDIGVKSKFKTGVARDMELIVWHRSVKGHYEGVTV